MNDLFTILLSVMEKLPATSYVRLVDIWLIFVQLYPFIQGNVKCANLRTKSETMFLGCFIHYY